MSNVMGDDATSSRAQALRDKTLKKPPILVNILFRNLYNVMLV